MNTQENVYNIIWIDDDIDTLLNESKTRILEKRGFNLIGVARTYSEFVYLMDQSYDKVDAVITDANFSSNSLAPKSEKDMSGLVKVRESIAVYNKKRDIPFYLYTGRGEILEEKCEDGELDYFRNNQRYFIKGQFGEMLEQIRIDVEHINSSSFRIRNKYKAELKAASLIDGNEELLMNALLYDYSKDWGNTEDYFNPMRKIAEAIFDQCKRTSILPDIKELSGIRSFLWNKENDNYIIPEGEEIMPRPLVCGLHYFLLITQDASHKRADLNLGIEKYVRETENINLFRSVLFIAMDLCLWYKKCEEETEDESFAPKWYLKETDDTKEAKIDEDSQISIPQKGFEHEGIVKKKGPSVYYCDNFYLQHHDKSGRYKEGDKIRIKKSKEIKKPFINGEGEEVTRFVNLRDIVKLE